MARTKKGSLRLDADFTEDAVALAIEALLTLISFPSLRYTLEPFSRSQERWLGADAKLGDRIRGFRPFYMQFKRPSGFPDYSSSSIISDRKSLGLETFPRALFFPLRQKRQHHYEYQHNILHKLRRRLKRMELGDAAYVCPLFLDRSAYRTHIHLAGFSRWTRFWRHHPWELEDAIINHGSRQIRFERIPMLTEHVTIPPHAKLANPSQHKYSFTERGTDLCFHSPSHLPDGSMPLATFLKKITGGLGNKITLENADEILFKLQQQDGEGPEIIQDVQEPRGENPIESWLDWGSFLKRKYDIDQYAIIFWDDTRP